MWELIFTIALKLMGFGLDKIQASTDQKKAFLAFVESMASRSNSAAKLSQSYRAQIERLKAGG